VSKWVCGGGCSSWVTQDVAIEVVVYVVVRLASCLPIVHCPVVVCLAFRAGEGGVLVVLSPSRLTFRAREGCCGVVVLWCCLRLVLSTKELCGGY